ncbi:MAG: hypothetical protein WCF84_12760 [Anaerolineae bacterium]
MSRAARSLLIYGTYLLILSLLLVIAPNLFLGLFGFSLTTEVWLRVAGVLLFYLAIYDIQAARAELTPFFRWSIYTRGSVIFVFIAFVLLGFSGPMLILFGVVDFFAAIWTALALKSEEKAR